VRPARLTNKPGRGGYRVASRLRLGLRSAISRADVASFVVDELAEARHLRAAPTLAY
jgi:putative NADH-flavin reductase